MKNKTTQELNEYAAVEILATNNYISPSTLYGKHYGAMIPYKGTYTDWLPLTDQGAYQLELLEAELVKLGINVVIRHTLDIFFITIQHISNDSQGRVTTLSALRCAGDYTIEQIRLTKLTAFCEAFEKFKELSNEQ